MENNFTKSIEEVFGLGTGIRLCVRFIVVGVTELWMVVFEGSTQGEVWEVAFPGSDPTYQFDWPPDPSHPNFPYGVVPV